MENFEYTEKFAQDLDARDPLAGFRSEFYFPKINGQPALYFTGNSLGLQPRKVAEFINRELLNWQKKGVEGHFEGDNPWFHYHKYGKETMADIVGAQSSEVVIMNSLTVNLHLLMVSFYRPSATRYKIIMEAGAFPSDQYAIESQVRFHGYDPQEAIVELQPKDGEFLLDTEDIIAKIDEVGDAVALVLLGGVQYFSGQFFDLAAITRAGHQIGANVGFDLAHAAGNVPLELHDWDVDFAVWCSYKYLNSGPGNLAGAFVHEKHANNQALPRFAGWWGHNEDERFLMKKGFIPMPGVDGWQLSNANIIGASAVIASLEIFKEAGFKQLRAKSLELTAFAEKAILQATETAGRPLRIITPKVPEARGCQLSIAIEQHGHEIFNYLNEHGVIADWREPNLTADQPGIIRIAPVPLYNSFDDIYQFTIIFKKALQQING